MDRWRGKVAVVTGASSGIGAAIVEKFVEEGLQVVGLARRKNRLDELAKKLSDKSGKLHSFQADITIEENILQAFKWTEDNLGPIHILVNNAGVARLNTLVNGDSKKWKEVIETNILGLCVATREAIKSMQNSGIDGHIVHINSVMGHTIPPVPYVNVYGASKYGVTALTDTLRKELVGLGSKIKVTSVSPGFVRTEIYDSGGFYEDDNVTKILESPLPSINCKDVADAIVYVIGTPPHVQITELTIKPVGEPY